MKFILILISLLTFNVIGIKSAAEVLPYDLCPLCTNEGKLTCPNGFEAACADEKADNTEPKCIFLQDKYVPGCWKFIGIKKLDFSLLPINLPNSTMISITGGGEVFTLNREIIGCKKL